MVFQPATQQTPAASAQPYAPCVDTRDLDRLLAEMTPQELRAAERYLGLVVRSGSMSRAVRCRLATADRRLVAVYQLEFLPN